MTQKEQYKNFCEQRSSEVPLFMQYWWMETVCQGKQWDVAMAWEGENITAVMPYHYGRKYGISFILQPQLTQYSGSLYLYPDGITPKEKIDFEKRAAAQLLSQVGKLNPTLFIQHFSPEVTNWLPFYWAGYHQSTRYTYRLEDISDTERLFQSFDRKERRKKIRRYEAVTEARFDMDAEAFASFHHRYWNAKGERDLLPEDFIANVCRTAIGRGNGVIASLHDSESRCVAACFVVYDSRCAYYLMSANDVGLHRNGHSETLLWALFRHLSGRVKTFDFEGSMDEGIEHFNRSLGAVQTPFFVISKCRNPLVRLLLKNRMI